MRSLGRTEPLPPFGCNEKTSVFSARFQLRNAASPAAVINGVAGRGGAVKKEARATLIAGFRYCKQYHYPIIIQRLDVGLLFPAFLLVRREG